MDKTMLSSVGLLFLRAGVGLMMFFGHGWAKLANFSQYAERFPDPIGLGSTFSLALAVFAEAGCSVLLVLGLGTRFAAVPLAITMLVAAFVIHAPDPWAKKELALLYAVPLLTLALTGGGRFALDAVIRKRRDG